MNIKKMTTLSMLTAVALTIFVIESYFPPLVPVSGVKMGLANVVTLLVLILYNRRDSFLVLILRIILASIFTGQAVNFLYSFAGGIACFLIMAFFYKILKGKYIVLISMLGAVFHNLGQICVAFFLLKSAGVLFYLPILIISGVITGFFTGSVASGLSKRLKKLGVLEISG